MSSSDLGLKKFRLKASENSRRYPGKASTFLRYRDVNFLSVLNSNEMEKERIRKAILGALRFGKPVVFDMEDANLFDQINTFIDNVQPGLYHSLLDGSVTKGKLEFYCKIF